LIFRKLTKLVSQFLDPYKILSGIYNFAAEIQLENRLEKEKGWWPPTGPKAQRATRPRARQGGPRPGSPHAPANLQKDTRALG
jgi:hypothetical protein